MKTNRKKELEEIESELMSLKQNERRAIFKIEETKKSEIELKELESQLELEIKFKELIFKKLGLNCEVNKVLVSKTYYWKQKMI